MSRSSSCPASGEGQRSAGLRAALLYCGVVVFLGLLSVSWRVDLGLGPWWEGLCVDVGIEAP